VPPSVQRRRDEAAELALDHIGKSDRRRVVETAADDLDPIGSSLSLRLIGATVAGRPVKVATPLHALGSPYGTFVPSISSCRAHLSRRAPKGLEGRFSLG
jgi:hypothetical protein